MKFACPVYFPTVHWGGQTSYNGYTGQVPAEITSPPRAKVGVSKGDVPCILILLAFFC